MTLLAYTPSAACAIPGGAGQLPEAAGETESGVGAAAATPFDLAGMWIWYVDRSEGGSVPAIVARARAAGIGTLYVKAGDGGDYWSQFSPGLVDALHHGGLDVCAWQFVYGERPLAEARVGAAAVRNGADCLTIDAEASYEGRYAAADSYVRALRARIGAAFPLALAGFPYVDYHPAFPYSVFFGPGGATVDQPQMYWRAIGTSVRAVYEHTYLFNRLWGHPIYPLGQTYMGPSRGELIGFRRYADSYGGRPPSWWDWQETSQSGWAALGASTSGPIGGYRPIASQPLLRRGSRGDLVVWAQQHLVGAGASLPVTGFFGPRTAAAVRSFQLSRGLPIDGTVGTDTWPALLETTPVRPRWSARRARTRRRGAARSSRPVPASRPLSASLPAHAYEIHPGPAP
ncbi:MAG TPA: peptidoglycan-binding domain-containing protein [Solirubrobacterales bacterium]